MIRRPPKSTLFPTRRSSDLIDLVGDLDHLRAQVALAEVGDAQREIDGRHFEVSTDLRRHREGFAAFREDRKSTRLNSSHVEISYAVFCLKKKNTDDARRP